MAFTQKPANKESEAERIKRLCRSIEEFNADPVTTNKIGDTMATIANICNTIDKVNKGIEELNKGLQISDNTAVKFLCSSNPFTFQFSIIWPTLNDFELCNLAKNNIVKGLVENAEEGFKGVADSVRKKGEKNFNQVDKCAQKLANLLGADDFSLAKSITGAIGLDMTSLNPIGSLTDCVDAGFNIQKQLNNLNNSINLKAGLASASSIASLGVGSFLQLGPAALSSVGGIAGFFKNLAAIDLCNQDLAIPEIPPIFDGVTGNFYVKLMCEIAKNCPDVVAESEACVNDFVAGMSDFMPTRDELNKELNDSVVGALDDTIKELTGLSYGETQKLLRACAKAGVIPEDSELNDFIIDDLGIGF